MARRRRVIAATVLGLPLAFAGLLAVEVLVATRRDYAPDNPTYVVDATVRPSSGTATGTPLQMTMLGDSTVAGLGAPTADESLAVQTAQRVADDLGREVKVRGLGVSGARVLDVRDEQAAMLTGDEDVVVAVVGANDVTHLTPTWRFDDQMASLLAELRERSGNAPVVLGGIPLFGEATALAQPLRFVVDSYARPLRRIQRDVAAQTPGVTFVNIAVEASPRFVGVPNAMSEDGFHPAPVGYGFWADAVSTGVVEALS